MRKCFLQWTSGIDSARGGVPITMNGMLTYAMFSMLGQHLA
jgi:hypothetical protein